MQSPELLLAGLNRALRDLRAAAHVLKDEQIDAALLPVMRRLLVAEVVGRTWIVAIGGSQSAGKTTLVRTMYDLHDEANNWLPPNEGLGEKLPVLIQEVKGCDRPEGYLSELIFDVAADCFELKDRPVSATDFQRAVKGEMPEVMLPILKVPQRFFRHDGQALMLLPGYEPIRKENEVWQDMMRQVLISAAGCIIVTDPTRLANQQQLEIVRDMLSNELRTTLPLVVVTKTESLASHPERLNELRQTAASVFGLQGEEALTRVICSGVGQLDYLAHWLPQLQAALRDLSVGGGETRQMQLARLESMLSRDLERVVNQIHHRADIFAHAGGAGDEGMAAVVKRFMQVFDDAAESLKTEHRREVEKMLVQQFDEARRDMQRRLAAEHEGILNKIVHGFDSVSETQARIEADVSGAWHAPGALLPQYVQALGSVTAPQLRVSGQASHRIASTSGHALQQLGYIDADGKALPSLLTQPEVQSNLAVLLGSQLSANTPQPRSNRELEKTVRLLPAMALEYTRLAGLMPALVGVHPVSLDSLPQMDLLESARRVQSQFEQFREVSGALLKGIALMLAVDVAADGQVDTVPALLSALGLAGSGSGAAAGGTAAVGSTVASAVAGVIAVGYLVHAALQEVQRHDGKVSALAHTMLLNIRDHHLVHFEAHFDDLMRQLRRHLDQSLRRRYGLDRRLMLQDRLAKALADVDSLNHDLIELLRRSGQTLLASRTEAA